MHHRWILVPTTILAASLTSCYPTEPVPPPFFTPRPPYPPQRVDPADATRTHGRWQRTPAHPPATTARPEPPPPSATPAPRTTSYPLARKTLNPQEVISPYPPNHRVDISGFRSGQLVRDPYTEKIFRIP